jgi:hypothetical protein
VRELPRHDLGLCHFEMRRPQTTLFDLFLLCPEINCQRAAAGGEIGATASMLTFHGKQQLKDERIAQVRAHRLADQLVHGTYWEDGKGCAVGCTVHSGEHAAYEKELGIPIELAYLEDRIFETLPNGKALLWPERFLQAIPVGVDLRATHINKRFVLALLADEKRGLLARTRGAELRKAMIEVIEFLKTGVAAPSPTEPPKELADLAYRADLAYLAYLADRAYRADLAYRAEILLEVLAASASSTSSRSLQESGSTR